MSNNHHVMNPLNLEFQKAEKHNYWYQWSIKTFCIFMKVKLLSIPYPSHQLWKRTQIININKWSGSIVKNIKRFCICITSYKNALTRQFLKASWQKRRWWTYKEIWSIENLMNISIVENQWVYKKNWSVHVLDEMVMKIWTISCRATHKSNDLLNLWWTFKT